MTDDNPLAGRTCAERITCFPSECIGESCSRFECCTADLIRARLDVDEMMNHPQKHRQQRRNRMGERS